VLCRPRANRIILSGKRKAETPSSESEQSVSRILLGSLSFADPLHYISEIIAVVSHRKKIRTSQSPPGSPAFKKLSPVTITCVLSPNLYLRIYVSISFFTYSVPTKVARCQPTKKLSSSGRLPMIFRASLCARFRTLPKSNRLHFQHTCNTNFAVESPCKEAIEVCESVYI
jgi:hypothetical protein